MTALVFCDILSVASRRRTECTTRVLELLLSVVVESLA
jgi:hypothetical protein